MPRFIIEEEPKAAPRFQILEEESAAPKYEGRPVVQNPDGSWSHERSITIEADGQHMNIPTMFGGKTYTPDQAVEIMRKNKWIDPDTGKRVQTFKSQEEALGAAQAKERAQQGERETPKKSVLAEAVSFAGGAASRLLPFPGLIAAITGGPGFPFFGRTPSGGPTQEQARRDPGALLNPMPTGIQEGFGLLQRGAEQLGLGKEFEALMAQAPFMAKFPGQIRPDIALRMYRTPAEPPTMAPPQEFVGPPPQQPQVSSPPTAGAAAVSRGTAPAAAPPPEPAPLPAPEVPPAEIKPPKAPRQRKAKPPVAPETTIEAAPVEVPRTPEVAEPDWAKLRAAAQKQVAREQGFAEPVTAPAGEVPRPSAKSWEGKIFRDPNTGERFKAIRGRWVKQEAPAARVEPAPPPPEPPAEPQAPRIVEERKALAKTQPAETAEQKLARLTVENEALRGQVAELPPEMEAPVGEEAPKTKVIRRRPGEKPAEAPAAEKPAAPAEQTLDQMTAGMDPERSQRIYQMLPDIARLRKAGMSEEQIGLEISNRERLGAGRAEKPLTDTEITAMIKEERKLEAEAPKPPPRVKTAPEVAEAGVLQPGKVKTLADMTPEEKAALEKRLGVKGVNLEAFAGIPRPALLRALGQSQLAQSYRAAVQGLGERILERVPNVFRAGRGTPIEFREAKIQVKTDIANLASDIRPLKEALEIAPWGESISAAERQRAYQLMQPGGTASTQPIKVGGQTRWAGPIMPQQVLQERQPFKAPTGQWIDPDFEARITAKTPPHIADAARKLRGMYLDAQQELQKLNAITPETVEAFGKNFGVYFPRMYGEYALRDKSMGQFLPSKPMRAGKSGRLLERGEHVEVDIPDLQKEMRSTARLIGPQSEFQAEFRAAADALRKARVLGKGVEAATHAYYDVITRAGIKPKPVVIGGNSYRISPVMDIESGLERTAALDPLLKAGYKVTGREGNRVSLFRDLTPAERAQLGELRKEPGYVAGQGLIESGKEIATRKLFRKVAENPEWSIDPKQLSLAGPMAGGGGIPVPTPTYTSPLLRRPQSWEQMANDPKKFGDLAGRYVRPDIAAELNEMVRVPEWYTKINDRLNVIWKMGKVLNLPTIGRNIVSSAEMARWGGLSPVSPEGLKSYHQAIMGLTGMDKTPETVALMNEARQLGLYTSSFSQGELGLLAHGYNISKEPNAVVRFLDGTINAIEKTKAPELYGSVDQFYKTALYIHNRLGRNADLGPQVSPLEAARHAKKFAIDYEDVSPFVRSISRLPFGSPFIRFSSKAIPLAIEAAAKHPVRFFSVPAAILGINALSKSPLDANQRLEMAQIQQAGNLRGPRFMVLPGGADKDGRYKFLDLGYQLPYGDVIEALDLLRGGTAAHVSFEPMGGTWGAAAEIAFNKSRFTGRQIWLETDTVTEMATKINDHLGKSLLPSWAPPIPFTGFRGGYSTEQLRKSFADYIPEALRQLPGEAPMSPTDWLGRSRSPAEAIASKVFGFDVKGASLTDIQRTAMVEVNNKLMEVSKQAAKFMAMDIPDSEKQRIMDRLALKYEDIAKEFESKFSVEQPKAKPAQPPPPPAREEAKRFQIQ